MIRKFVDIKKFFVPGTLFRLKHVMLNTTIDEMVMFHLNKDSLIFLIDIVEVPHRGPTYPADIIFLCENGDIAKRSIDRVGTYEHSYERL